MKLPTLYGFDSKGNVKEWTVNWMEDGGVTVFHGRSGGTLTRSRSQVIAKNIGKANETSLQEQASSEAHSKWAKQIKKGYAETVATIPVSTLPNLAVKYQDRKNDIVFPCDVLPKLDGVRCSVFIKDGSVFFQSRGGEDYPVIGRIARELDHLIFSKYPDAFVDGELYRHGMFLEDITSAVKKPNKDTHKLEFQVFDMIVKSEPDMSWVGRRILYQDLLKMQDEDSPVQKVNSFTVPSHEEIAKFQRYFLDCGYEGTIIRNHLSTNTFGKRTTSIIKLKDRLDDEFKVVGFELGKNGKTVSAVCEVLALGEIKTFKAPLVGDFNHQMNIYNKREFLVAKGSHLRVSYEALSKYGIPAKPKGHEFRDLDNNGNPLN